MKGLFSGLLPFVPDSVGAIAAFAESPALVIVNDMNGTLVTFHQRVGAPEGSPAVLRSAKDVRELAYVLGRDEDFLRNYRKIVERTRAEAAAGAGGTCGTGGTGGDHAAAGAPAAAPAPLGGIEHVVLVPGPVASTVGVDGARLAHLLEGELHLPVLALASTGSGDHEQGLSEAMLSAFGLVDGTPADPREGALGLLGVNLIDHPRAASRDAFSDLLASMAGGRIVSRWGTGGTLERLRAAARAQRNVVASTSGLALARAMERAWGVPFVRADELPLDGCAAALPLRAHAAEEESAGAGAQRVLLVGEQIGANLLRRALVERAGLRREQAVVGWFFGMDAARSDAGDVQLGSERDLAALVRDGGFDAVFADPALRACLPAETRLFPLRNLSVSDGPAAGTPRARELRTLASRGDPRPWREGEALMAEPAAWTPEWFCAIDAFLHGAGRP